MMNLEKMKERKKEMHLTNQELAERSGVPLGTRPSPRPPDSHRGAPQPASHKAPLPSGSFP